MRLMGGAREPIVQKKVSDEQRVEGVFVTHKGVVYATKELIFQRRLFLNAWPTFIVTNSTHFSPRIE